ncbi:hypothetical protein OUZ56_014935 [Daphnia magna]|uniref:Uncharacterized protein n=1 Tax=Daphnia magna TaxID=35525 RepID=A0ABR0ALB3_9CRUS|nr:hypothetical protein OUZ56_014935 [Daphnia magna]
MMSYFTKLVSWVMSIMLGESVDSSPEPAVKQDMSRRPLPPIPVQSQTAFGSFPISPPSGNQYVFGPGSNVSTDQHIYDEPTCNTAYDHLRQQAPAFGFRKTPRMHEYSDNPPLRRARNSKKHSEYGSPLCQKNGDPVTCLGKGNESTPPPARSSAQSERTSDHGQEVRLNTYAVPRWKPHLSHPDSGDGPKQAAAYEKWDKAARTDVITKKWA